MWDNLLTAGSAILVGAIILIMISITISYVVNKWKEEKEGCIAPLVFFIIVILFLLALVRVTTVLFGG